MRIAMAGVLAVWLASTATVSAQQRVAEHHLHRLAPNGTTIRIRGHVNFHECGTFTPTTIVVQVAPQHGTLEIRDEQVKATDPDLGTGEKCREFVGMGKVVYYTRTSPGHDSFNYDSQSANGVVHYYLDVD
jgi:hypothetical protein